MLKFITIVLSIVLLVSCQFNSDKNLEADSSKAIETGKEEIEQPKDNEKNVVVEQNEEIVYIEAEEAYLYPREKVSEENFLNSDFHQKVPEATYSEYIESNENRFLSGLQTETFGSQEIIYEEITCAYIPMHSSINSKYASKQIINFGGEHINELKLTIFGELEDVKVLNYTSGDGDPEERNLGNVINSELIINASLPNDMSRVDVVGKHNLGEGEYVDIKIVLDNLRDLSEYAVIRY